MGRRVVTMLSKLGIEDFFLGLGVLLVSCGVGIAFGYAFGLIIAGALFIAYGIWITKGGGE